MTGVQEMSLTHYFSLGISKRDFGYLKVIIWRQCTEHGTINKNIESDGREISLLHRQDVGTFERLSEIEKITVLRQDESAWTEEDKSSCVGIVFVGGTKSKNLSSRLAKEKKKVYISFYVKKILYISKNFVSERPQNAFPNLLSNFFFLEQGYM